MKKSTSRLIFTFVAVFLLIVAATSMLGNIDSAVDDIVGNGGGGSDGGGETTTTTKAPVTTKAPSPNCNHFEHDLNGYCYECSEYVGHDYAVDVYDPQNDGTHVASYTCSNCGDGGSSGPISCTYRDGKCIYCDAINCLHILHNEEGYCVSCGTVVDHIYEYNYASIEGDDFYHEYTGTCTVCGHTYGGNQSHKYNGDLTCDRCGYTAVVEE